MNPHVTKSVKKMPSTIDIYHAQISPKVSSDFKRFKDLRDGKTYDEKDSVQMVKKMRLQQHKSQEKLKKAVGRQLDSNQKTAKHYNRNKSQPRGITIPNPELPVIIMSVP